MRSILKRLMTHTLSLHRRERNWQGDFTKQRTYNNVKGFVQYGTKVVMDRKGEEVVSSAIIFMPDTAPIDPSHEYWMIDQTAPYERKDMEVIRIDPIDDPRTGKIHHYEVAVK